MVMQDFRGRENGRITGVDEPDLEARAADVDPEMRDPGSPALSLQSR
jgi:hypothetical protein